MGIRESVGEFVAFEPYFDEAAAWGHVGMVSKAFLGAVQEERLAYMLENSQTERFGISWGSVIGMVNYRKCLGGGNFPLYPSCVLEAGLIIKLT